MFKKILKYSVLITAIYLWIQAYSPFVYREIGGKLKLFPDDYRYGDLYRLSLLPQFKEKAYECEHQRFTRKKPINLYIIGDSFTEDPKIKLEDFPIEKYHYVHWAKSANYQLDTTKQNILILETVERTVEEHFSSIASNFGNQKQSESQLSFRKKIEQKTNKVEKMIVPDGIEERLAHTIFNYDFFLWFRELKSTLNFKIFNRVEDEVVFSKDKMQIFYADEADASNSKSAFYYIVDSKIDLFVQNINQTREKYLKAGFDEVYLSIIPNKVSILSPDLGSYNHLIERIQNNKQLQIPFIDTYSVFKKSPQKYYLKSDTHWTCEGREVWLQKVNSILAQ
ncbi:MAG: hypothetical protein U5N85_09140 [Arcicella sp.]|nr:hypothetical protein [Arcicella sp.]